MIYLDNKYTKLYYSIITAAKARSITLDYYEKHHIIPDCFYQNRKRKGPPGFLQGNPNSHDNIVMLKPREHFICHRLLTKMVTGKMKSKMILALLSMCRISKNQERISINSTTYNKIRIQASIANTGENNPMWGRTRTDEEKEKISNAVKSANKSHVFLTEEHKRKISESKLKSNFRHSDDTRALWSLKRKGRPGMINNKGKHWYNDGTSAFLVLECPPGCVPGRLRLS